MEKLTSGNLDLEFGSGGIDIAVVGWVNEFDGVTGPVIQGHIGDGEILHRTINLAWDPQKRKSVEVYDTSRETSTYSSMEKGPLRMSTSSFTITIEIGEGSPLV
jgi:hypothetical protein